MQPVDINSPLKLEYLQNFLQYDPVTGIWVWKIGPSNAIKSGSRAGKIVGGGYRQIAFCGWLYYSARLAWFYQTGNWPKERIDHINRVRDDDRWVNLREASESDQCANRQIQINNTSGYKGVSWSIAVGKWDVRVNRLHIGYYDNLAEAVAVRDSIAVEFQGDFAVLNT
jgi:hypothetical protein